MDTVNNITEYPVEERRSGTAKWWVIGGAFGALIIANGLLFHRVNTLETDLSNERVHAQTQFTELRDATASAAVAMNKSFDEFSSQLQEGTKTASAAAQRAAATAQKNAEQLVGQLRAQQQANDQKFAQEIGAVKSVTEEHAAKVSGLETSVGTVKETVGTVQQEVAANKSALDQTIAELKSTRGDLGVQSGLIATNAKELAALRELGERNYVEFTVSKKSPSKVANMTIDLKKADPKHNRYNLEITADDKRIEKKDKTVNEPVQMYLGGARQPYEIVVNQVGKDTVVGYVAVPIVLQAAR
jgi:hypothetical protein